MLTVSPLLINIVLEGIINYTNEKIGGEVNGKKAIKSSLFADNRHLENSM